MILPEGGVAVIVNGPDGLSAHMAVVQMDGVFEEVWREQMPLDRPLRVGANWRFR